MITKFSSKNQKPSRFWILQNHIKSTFYSCYEKLPKASCQDLNNNLMKVIVANYRNKYN